MPELPEVETIRRTLLNHILGRKILDVKVGCDRIIRSSSVSEFESHVIGSTLEGLDRRGKYLIFHLSDGEIIVHLRMEGRFFIKADTDPIAKHEHVIWELSDHLSLRYHDVRKFGTMEWTTKGQWRTAQGLNRLGYEPSELRGNAGYLFQRLSRSHRPIKALLLDQTIISGLGNIYVDEVLFLSRIHPQTPGARLTSRDVEKVLANAISVLELAVERGGTTIRTYVSSLGVSGRFQNELNVHTRAGRPCPVCGETIMKMKVAGRGTYVCPKCQSWE
jgi:formamidopyrimidine-DNA glycosylase